MKKLYFLMVLFVLISLRVQGQVVFAESFDDGVIPSGWQIIDADGDGYNWNGMANYSQSGSGGCVYSSSWISGYGALSPDNWLITPAIHVPSFSTLSFWTRGSCTGNYSMENYGVYVSTTGSSISDFEQQLAYIQTTESYEQHEIDLSAYAGQTVYIAFRHYNTYDMCSLLLDEIKVLTSSPYITVISEDNIPFFSYLGSSDMEVVQVVGNQLNNVINVQTSAPFEVSAGDGNFSTSVAMSSNGGWFYVRYNPTEAGHFEATLTISTTYTISEYEDTIMSKVITLQGDAFDCSVLGLPISESFESVTGTILASNTTEYCWEYVQINADDWRNGMHNSIEKAYAGNQSFRFSSANYNNQQVYDQYLISPEISSNSPLMVMFRYANSSSAKSEIFRVGYSTTGKALEDFVWGEDIVNAGNTDWHLYRNANIPAGAKYVAIHYKSNNQAHLYIDDFKITEAPSCLSPLNLQASGATANTVMLTWTPGGQEDAWMVAYGPAPLNMDAAEVVQLTSSTSQLSGLNPDTQYEFKVCAVCGTASYSEWSDIADCHTAGIPASVPYTQTFEDNDADRDNWVLVNGNQPHYFVYGSPSEITGKALMVTYDGVNNIYNLQQIEDEHYAGGHVMVTDYSSVWAYRDIQFPTVANAPGYMLNVDWKCNGELGYDFGEIYIGDVAAVPSIERSWNYDMVSSGDYVPSGFLKLARLEGTETWQSSSYFIPAENVAGKVQRLYVLWTNDSLVGTQPPLAIDNISIVIPNSYNLTGTVTDADSQEPIAGAYIYLKATSGFTTSCQTGANGNYWIQDVFPDTYEVYVSAEGYQTYEGYIYTGEVSQLENFQLTLKPCAMVPVNAEMNMGDGNLELNWEQRGKSFISKADNFEYLNDGGLGVVNPTGSLSAYHLFTPEDLAIYDGYTINSVNYLFNATQNYASPECCTYTIRIWVGGTGEVWSGPSRLLYEREITPSEFYSQLNPDNLNARQWMTFGIDPIVIDASDFQYLWIGYEAAWNNAPDGSLYPCARLNSIHEGYGNVIVYNGNWQVATGYRDFAIRANVEAPEVLYNVYADDELIASNVEASYLSGLSLENLASCYQVETVCANGMVSSRSECASFGNLRPSVQTTSVYNVTFSSADVEGVVNSEGVSSLTVYGFCWGTTPEPTLEDNQMSWNNYESNLSGYGATIENLQPGTTYYVRAFATNSMGTAYGDVLEFTTYDYSTVSGNVTDANTGLPLEGVMVNVYFSSSFSIIGSVITDQNGHYVIDSIPATEMYINLSYDNEFYQGMWFGVQGQSGNNIVNLTLTPICGRTPYQVYYQRVDDQLVLSWRSAEVSSYNIYINSQLVASGVEDTAYTWPLSSYFAPEDYCYQVSSVCENGVESGWSECAELIHLPPTVSTTSVGEVTSSSALCSGEVIDNGNDYIYEYGFCCSLDPDFDQQNTWCWAWSDYNSVVNFAYMFTGLQSDTTYYVRAYAENYIGRGYGNTVSFTTPKECQTPAALNVQDITSNSAMVRWQNANVENTDPVLYELSYKAAADVDWTTVSNIENEYFFLSGLQPQTSYLLRVRMICDENNSSDYAEQTFWTECLVNTEESIIGNETNTSYGYCLPIYLYYYSNYSNNYHSYSQQIYLASEIGGPRIINQLSLQYYYYNAYSQNNIQIYLGHTSKEMFSNTTDWVSPSALSLVYSGELNFNNSGVNYWYDIVLDSAFVYNGTDNLVMVFIDNNDAYYVNSSSSKFYTHNTSSSSAYRSMYLYSTSVTYNIDVSSYYGNRTYYRNNLKLPGVCIMDGCERTNVAVGEVTDSSALLLIAEGSGIVSYELEYRQVGEEGFTPISYTGSEFWLTGLKQNTEYEVRVHSLCTNDTSDWKTTLFTTGVKNLDRLYVKTNHEGEGKSWEDASGDLAWTLEVAGRIRQTYGTTPEIWVAEGTYYGDGVSASAFTMVDGVNVYGGFAGNEIDLSQRDYVAHPTILDGLDRQRVLVQEYGFSQRAVWDGFTIQHGNNGYGSAAYLSAMSGLSHCTIINNNSSGNGAIYASGSSYAHVIIDSCLVAYNTCSGSGGGIYAAQYATISNSTITQNNSAQSAGGIYANYTQIRNCTITHNNTSNNGGGIYVWNVDLSAANQGVFNCLIANNTAAYNGGGVFVSNSSKIENSTIVGNSSNTSGAGVCFSSYQTNNVMTNSVVWGNYGTDANIYDIAIFQNCAIEGGAEVATGVMALQSDNIGSVIGQYYPYFVFPESGDYRLRAGSALINAGVNLSDLSAMDLAGEVRVYDETVDIGCYEFHGEEYCTRPSAFSVSEITGSSALLTWRNSNSNEPLYYEISYKTEEDNDWTVVSSLHEDYYLFSGLQPQTEYSVRLRAACDEGNLTDYAEMSFNTSCSGGVEETIVGTPYETTNTNGNWLPLTTWYNYTYSQQIYTADELGGARTIDTIYLQYFYSNQYTRNVTVYLGHTPKSEFSNSYDWIPFTNLTQVYNGNITFKKNTENNDWFAIPLTTSFEYNGTDNLVMVFDDNTGSYTNSDSKFRTHNTEGNQSLYIRSDGTNYNPSNTSSYSGTLSSYRNNLRLPGSCSAADCDRANMVVRNVTDSSALLVFVAGSESSGCELQYRQAGDNDYITLYPTEESTYQLMGLTHGTEYEARIRSLCGDTVQSEWKMVYFNTLAKHYDHLYVRENGTGDGGSWDNASGDLAWTLNLAAVIKQQYNETPVIWVAQGTYYGDSVSNNAFTMVEGVNVYGGFVCNENENYDLSLRDIAAHPTILDGQNNQRVLCQTTYFMEPTLWDGFTLQHGYASYSNNNGNGAGVYLNQNVDLNQCQVVDNVAQQNGGGVYIAGSNVNLNHCHISNNTAQYGGGVYAYGTDYLFDCSITHNTASNGGGGVYSNNTTMSHCDISYNHAGNYINMAYGGGIYLNSNNSGMVVDNCLIANNTVSYGYGGGIYANSTQAVANSTIVNNQCNGTTISSYTAAIYNMSAYNCIIWGNRNDGGALDDYTSYGFCYYCAVEGVCNGSDNIILMYGDNGNTVFAPRFVNPSATVGYEDVTPNVDWHLQEGSICANRGNNMYLSEADSLDLDGQPRVRKDTVDIGCYESNYNSCVIPEFGDIVYVTQEGAGDRSGSSWSNAMSSLSDALLFAYITDADVWVAAGTYYGDSVSSNAFVMCEGVNVYGGFAGNETELSERDYNVNLTILDGQNSQRVLYQPNNFGVRTVWDGFVIQHGYANSNNVNGYGAGAYLYNNSSLVHCSIMNNNAHSSGGGVFANGSDYSNSIILDSCAIAYNSASNSEGGGAYVYYTQVKNSTITHNTAFSNGGGVCISLSLLDHCEIAHNTSTNYNGGGVYVYSTSMSNMSNDDQGIFNCLIAHNRSNNYGGGVYVNNSVRIDNSTIVNNESSYSGGGIRFSTSSGNNVVRNSVVWGNTVNGNVDNLYYYSYATFQNSAVEGGVSGNTDVMNLQSDNYGYDSDLDYPFFVSPDNGNYRLRDGSALINAGLLLDNMPATDMAGEARVYDDTVDIGCYEFHDEVYCTEPVLLTIQDVTGSSALISWHNSNMNEPLSYELAYKTDEATEWTLVSSIHTDYYMLNNLQPQSAYMVRVRAICDGENVSDYTNALSFNTNCSGQYAEEVIIGTDASTEINLPIHSYYPYSYTQQIYLSDEVGEARTIDTIYLQYFNSNTLTRTLHVYLGHTQKSYFESYSSGYLVNSGLEEVFAGEFTFDNSGENYWIGIPLQTPFEYNGTDNLVLVFRDSTAQEGTDWSTYFYGTYTDAYRAVYYAGYDVLDLNHLSSYYDGYYTSLRSNVRFPAKCSEGCDRANVSILDVTNNSALVTFVAGNSATGMQMEYRQAGSGEYIALPTDNSPYLLTGLRQNTQYELRVRSICSANENSNWVTRTFQTDVLNLDRLYVDSAIVNGDASSWQNASNDFAWTLSLAQTIKEQFGTVPEIWVAKGTYFGDSTSYNAFTMVEGVNVYGGFAGGENELSERDYNANLTVLDGQNNQRVLYQSANYTTRTVWDGFTLQHGYANSSSENGNGGGVYLRQNASLLHCQLLNNRAQNYGGGAYLYSNNSNSSYQPILDSCVVKNNTSYYAGGVHAYYSQVLNSTITQNTSSSSYGGGIYSNYSLVDHCVIAHNTANSNGGGIYSNYSLVDHCVITHNTANSYGGGMYVNYTSLNNTNQGISNCLIAHNTANSTYGGGIYTYNSVKIENSTIVNNQSNSNGGGVRFYTNQSYNLVKNSVIWGNKAANGSVSNLYNENYATFQNSAVEGGVEGNTEVMVLQSANNGTGINLNYPLFVAPSNDDYRLRDGSALINAGVNLDNMPSTDLAGEVRVYDETVDIGCYEYHGEVYCTEPEALAVEDITGSSALVTWNNSNVQAPWYYELSYKTENATEWTTVSEQIQSDYYLLGGLTQQTSYAVRVRAICDELKVSDYTETVFSTSCSNYIEAPVVGTPDAETTENGNLLPSNMYYRYSYTQQLYMAEELGGAQTIDRIALQYIHQNQDTRNMDIYIGHTNKLGFLGAYDWVPSSDMTLVYSGSVTFNNQGDNYWLEIPFNVTSFAYNGTDNLVIAFDDNTGNYPYSGVRCRTHNTLGNQSIYVYTDNFDYSPSEANNSYSGTLLTYRNNLRLSDRCIDGGCDRANAVVSETTDSSALITFVAGTGAMGVQMEYAKSGSENYIALPTETSPYMLTGLKQNTTYELRIRSICGGNEYSSWVTRVFQTGVMNLDHLYVTTTGTGDASSWNEASSDFTWTLNTASRIKEEYGTSPVVWVAEGIYYGDSVSANAFTMVEGVDVYGGFAGNEPVNYDLSLRDFDAHATVLDGQHNQRVLYQPAGFNTNHTIWDGFTIQNGKALYGNTIGRHGGGAWLKGGITLNNLVVTNNYAYNNGAGIYCEHNFSSDTTYVLNCSFTYNNADYGSGGGAYLSGGRILANNCEFAYNEANSDGGGLYNLYSAAKNSRFSHNTASDGAGVYNRYGKILFSVINYNTASNGGGVYLSYYNDVALSNCLIANNTSTYSGAGVYDATGNYINNSTIVRNNITNTSAESYGAGIYNNSSSSVRLTDCIVWGNTKNGNVSGIMGPNITNYSASDDGGVGEHNVALMYDGEAVFSPRFVKASVLAGAGDTTSNVDWHLAQGSPCVNRGIGSAGDTYDLAGDARVQQDTIDLGCYESPYNSVLLPTYDSIVYVVEGGAGTMTGESWANAMGSLQDAIQIAAMNNAKVWVAAGTYYGNVTSENAFVMKPGVNVYGGFAGTEAPDFDLSQRDFAANASVLDGQYRQRVLMQYGHYTANTAVVWDGFTIQNGRVNGDGAGVYMRGYATLRNCTVQNNMIASVNATSNTLYGAGVCARGDANKVAVISNCKIAYNGYANISNGYGGGIYTYYTNVDHTEISHNTATNRGGGGYLSSYSTFSNCLIFDNTAQNFGGGLFLQYNQCSIINCDIVNNTTTYSGTSTDYTGGIYSSYAEPVLTNCIVWGNKKGFMVNNFNRTDMTNVTYCAIEGGYSGEGNISLEATNDGNVNTLNYVRFNDPQNEDYRLHPTSNCVNTGNDAVVADTLDFYGNQRVIGSSVDIGCSEAQDETDCPSVINLTVSNITTHTAQLSWQPSGTESQWVVVYSELNSGVSYSKTVYNTPSCLLDTLSFNRSYSAKVRAVCDGGSTSIYSIPVNFQTTCDTNALDTLSDFNVEAMQPADNEIIYGNTSSYYNNVYVDFSWNAMEHATSYDFYLWRDTESEPSIPSYSGMDPFVNNFILPEYQPGVIYHWKVVAWNECLSKISPTKTIQANWNPDLHVSGFTFSQPVSTQSMTVTWTVVNDGLGNTPPGATWNDYIWISPVDGVGGGFWYNVSEVLLATVPNVEQLLVGESYTRSAQVTIPAGYVGSYYMFVFTDQRNVRDIDYSPTGQPYAPEVYTPSADGIPYPYLSGTVYGGGNNVKEEHEHDNFFFKVIDILPPPSPDLIITSEAHTGVSLSGHDANVSWTVTNNGEAAAFASWTDVVYLSGDTLLDTESDLRIGRVVHNGPLAVDSSYRQELQFTVPVDFSGDYYFIIETDYNNTIYEGLAEMNNRFVSTPMHVNMSWFTDLQVVFDTIPEVVDANGSYNCYFTVTNYGSSPTNVNRWTDVVYISSNPVFSVNNAMRMNSIAHTGVLAANDVDNPENSSYHVVCPITIPGNITGSWYLHVVTDFSDEVYEYNAEGNNIYTHPTAMTVYNPDLTVSSIVVPEIIDPNVPTRIQWTIRNQGPGKVVRRSFSDKFFFNGDLLYTASVNNVNISAGDSIVRYATVQIPCVADTSAVLTITTDAESQVYEAVENNNSTAINLYFRTPDLAVSEVTPITDLTSTSDNLWSGNTAELSYTLTNNGEVAVSAHSVVDKIYFSTSADSYQEADSIWSNTHSLNLEAGGSETYSCMVTIPNGISGVYYYHVVCNVNGAVCEGENLSGNEGESVAVEVLLSPSPDLVITSLIAPTEAYLGAGFDLTYTVANQGNAAVNSTVMQKFYYSMSSAAYDTRDIITSIPDYLNLAAGESMTTTVTMTLPVNIVQGTYYIHMVTDANDQVYEHNGELNNRTVSNSIWASKYQLDLQLTQIEGPDVMEWGETAVCTLHVHNNSNLPTLASSWRDVVYLSSNSVLETQDQLMQGITHREMLEAGGDYEVEIQVTIPYGTPSPVYLIGITDFNNDNPDININNNQLIKQLTINTVPTPDLAVSEVEVLDDVRAGQTARIVYKVTNVGEVAIVQQTWNDKLFVSYNDTYESNDLQLTNRDRQNISLAQNEYYRDTLTFTVPLPYNGDLYLLMMANASNNPFESVRENNTAALAVNVIMPAPGDLVVTDISCENTIVSGQILHAEWTVQNVGDNPITGNGLNSLVYISADTTFDANDRLLGRVTSNNVDLGIDATMQQSLAGRISGLAAGEYYLIVKTDVSNAFNEVDDNNNTACMLDPFTVTIRPLPFNTDVYDTLVNNEVSDYVLMTTADTTVNQTVRIHIASEDVDMNAVNMIYATYNNMGDNLNYSYSTIGQYTANAELYIPSTQYGYYGVNIYGSTPSNLPQNTIVRADILPFELMAVNDNRGGNTGVITVELTGSRFRPDMEVYLRHGNEVITADSLIYVNYYQAFAQFDLTGHTPGVYDVVAVNLCEGEAVLYNAFTIENGLPSGLAYNLLFPSSPRPNRTVVMMLEYGNTGNVDLHNQVLEIISIGGSPIALTSEGLSQQRTTLRVPLSIEGEPAGLLRPGSYGTLNIYGFTSGALIFTIKPVEE